METLSIKISAAEKQQLQRIADLRSVSMSQLLREGLHKILDESQGKELDAHQRKAMRLLEEHWTTTTRGPADLSTNKKHMEGFGRS